LFTTFYKICHLFSLGKDQVLLMSVGFCCQVPTNPARRG